MYTIQVQWSKRCHYGTPFRDYNQRYHKQLVSRYQLVISTSKHGISVNLNKRNSGNTCKNKPWSFCLVNSNFSKIDIIVSSDIPVVDWYFVNLAQRSLLRRWPFSALVKIKNMGKIKNLIWISKRIVLLKYNPGRKQTLWRQGSGNLVHCRRQTSIKSLIENLSVWQWILPEKSGYELISSYDVVTILNGIIPRKETMLEIFYCKSLQLICSSICSSSSLSSLSPIENTIFLSCFVFCPEHDGNKRLNFFAILPSGENPILPFNETELLLLSCLSVLLIDVSDKCYQDKGPFEMTCKHLWVINYD